MSIKWVSLNVPMHRRMEVLGVSFVTFLVLGGGMTGTFAFVFFLFFGNPYLKTLSVLYLVFLYFDWNAGDTGGRGVGFTWFRRRAVWKHFVNYFPIDLVKTVDLPADRNYLIALFPHGVLCQGAFGNFSTAYTKWFTLYPQIRPKLTGLGQNFYVPFFREILLSTGMSSASANALNTLLNQSNDPNHTSNRDGYTANAVVLMVGGAEEAYHANSHKLVLKNRKGFVRIALKNGSCLVPAISFGETNYFDVIEHKPGSKWRNFQDAFKRHMKFALVHFNGRGFLQYSFGLIPRRHPITTVIGQAIIVKKIDNPSDEDVNELHLLFCKRLNELFEAHKIKYIQDAHNVHLELI